MSAIKTFSTILLAASCVLGVVNTSFAQDRRFTFDTSGNLTAAFVASSAAPQILSHPQLQVVRPGALASFYVVATDTRGLSYQWRYNGTNISAATNDALLLTNVSIANDGLYSVVLNNSSGSVTSAPAALMLDGDGDGLGDSWEQTYFTNLNQFATGDFDGDGVSNLEEFLSGTNPTNNASAVFKLTVLSNGGAVDVSPVKLTYTNGEPVTLTATAIDPEVFHGWTGDIGGTSNQVTLFMTGNKTVIAHFQALSLTWTNAAGGSWHTPSNWSPNFVPLSVDDVSLPLNVTITIDTNAECRELTLASGTLTGAGNLTINGNSSWTSGTMSGSGRTIIAPGATLTINSPFFTLNLARALENGGTTIWTGAPGMNLNNAVITNRPGALFHVLGAQTLGSGGGSPRFDNAGTFRKSVNNGAATFNIPFNNYGELDLQTGTLHHNGSFVNNGSVTLAETTHHRMAGGGSASGTFSASLGSLMEWVGGVFPLTAGAQLNGTGTYWLNGATVNFDTDVVVQKLELHNGTFGGSGTVSISNAMNWIGGTMSGSGRTIVAPGATMNMASPFFTISLTGRTLENGGTFFWTTAAGLYVNGAVITNRVGALFHAQNSGTLTYAGGSARFDNAGTFRKSASTGTTTFGNLPFNNYGTVEIQTGTLHSGGSFLNNGAVTLAAGTTHRMSVGGSATGTFSNPSTALVDWTGGTFTLNSGAKLNGAGQYQINGAAVTFNTDATVQLLNLLAGTLDGPNVVTIGNAMTWSSGTMSGAGRTVIAPGASFLINNSFFTMTLARILENAGTVNWTGAAVSLNNTIITNRTGAIFNVQNANSLNNGGGFPRFDNAGTFRKSGNTGTSTLGVPLNNYGTVDLRTGILSANTGFASASNAVLNLALGGTNVATGYSRLQVGGTVTLNGALVVDFTSGFVPAMDDLFTVVNAGSRNGGFSSFVYPSNQVTLLLSNTPSAVILKTIAVAPPEPIFFAPVLEGPNVRLIWTATTNATYRLEYTGAVDSTNWTALPGDVTTLSNTATKLDTLNSTNRFYRVRMLP